jgi:hypothetical protein
MRLTDLDPRWYAGRTGDRQGFTFACPCCAGATRLAVAVHLDGTNLDPDPECPQQFAAGEYVWTVAGGSGFSDLSLTPSVDASGSGHWHGHITDGEIR